MVVNHLVDIQPIEARSVKLLPMAVDNSLEMREFGYFLNPVGMEVLILIDEIMETGGVGQVDSLKRLTHVPYRTENQFR